MAAEKACAASPNWPFRVLTMAQKPRKRFPVVKTLGRMAAEKDAANLYAHYVVARALCERGAREEAKKLAEE